MLIVDENTNAKRKLSAEEIKILETLKENSIVPDEECSELTDEQLKQLAEASREQRQENRKQTVSVRLSPQALKKAQSLGKGYTSVLSRILESALNDNDLIKRYL